MKRSHLSIALLGLALAGLLIIVLPRTVQHHAPAPALPTGAETSATQRPSNVDGAPHGAAIGFRSHERTVEHFRKHGREFGNITMDEYVRRAQTLRDAPVGGDVLEMQRGDGTTVRFDRATGAFIAFSADGVIRTFFKPNDGERYFERQRTREGTP